MTELFYPYVLGGGENRYYWLAKNLVKLGHEVFVYTQRIENTPKVENHEGINIIRLGSIGHSKSKRKYSLLAQYFIDSILTMKDLLKKKLRL